MKGHKRARPDRGADVWELIAEAGRDPVTGRRKQRSRIFRGTQSAADTALAHLIADVTRERCGPGSDAPLSALIDAWLALVEADLSPTTVHRYRRIAELQIAPVIGKRPINAVTTPELDAYYRRLLEDLAPATVRQVHAIIRRAFRQAVRWGWLAVNPAAEATPPRVRRTEPHVPHTDQVLTILAAATKQAASDGLLFRLLAETGARRGEIAGLHESRLNLTTGTVVIDRALIEVGGTFTEKETKGKQSRPVAIGPGTVALLRKHLRTAKELAFANGAARSKDPYVFSESLDGSIPLRPDVISGRFRRLAATHAPGVRLHDLRHYTATTLLASGVPVKTVSARLGHASAAMTLDVYAHALEPADRHAADLLGGLLDG